MSDHVYKTLDLYGTSATSIEDAIQKAVAKAARTVRNMRWLTMTELRGHIEEGKVTQWQVGIRIGFTLDD